jgi:hypothetical protein
MRFPKHWVRATRTRAAQNGRAFTFTCWGWSDESAEVAQREAAARACYESGNTSPPAAQVVSRTIVSTPQKQPPYP